MLFSSCQSTSWILEAWHQNSRMLLLRTSMEPFWSNYQFGSSLDVWFQQPIGGLVDGTQVPKSMVLHEIINVSHLFQSQEILLSISWIMVSTLSVLQKKNHSFTRTQNGLLCEDTDPIWSVSEVYQPKRNPKYGTGKQDLKAWYKSFSDNYKMIHNELNLNKGG